MNRLVVPTMICYDHATVRFERCLVCFIRVQALGLMLTAKLASLTVKFRRDHMDSLYSVLPQKLAVSRM